MTLDEAVKILRQHNITGASVQRITNGRTLEKDLLVQILNACESFMTERTEYKRLLKAAVEDLDSIYCKLGDNCEPMPDCGECLYTPSNRGCYCKWRYADEVLALIGDESNGI